MFHVEHLLTEAQGAAAKMLPGTRCLLGPCFADQKPSIPREWNRERRTPGNSR